MIQIKVGNEFLDVDQSQNIALQKKLGDLSDPSARGASIAYDLSLPITDKNKRILQYIDSPYTELKELKENRIEIYADGILISEGLFSVTTINNEYYNISIVNLENEWLNFFENNNLNVVDWNDELCQSKAMIDNLARSGLTHKYCAPLIDYGNLREITINSSAIYYSDIYPAIFVLPLLQSLFRLSGYTLISDFFSKELNENLCMPFSKDFLQLKDPTIQTEDVDYVEATASPGLNNLTAGVPKLLEVDTVIQNKNNYLSLIPHVFFDVQSEWYDDVFGSLTCGNTRGFDAEIALSIDFQNILLLPPISIMIETLVDGAVVDTQTFTASSSIYIAINYSHIIQNLRGTQNVQVRLRALSGNVIQLSEAKLFITRLKLADKTDTENLKFYLKDTLPDINCYDFLKDILTVFNLYAITDNNNKTVNLLQYNDLRKTASYVYDDWKDRCSKENNILEINTKNLPAKTLYTYASADDFLCKTYENANQYPFGYYVHNNPNSINNGEIYQVAANNIRPTVMGFFRTLYYVPQYWQDDYNNSVAGDPITTNTGIGLRLLKYIVATEQAQLSLLTVQSEYGAPIHTFPAYQYPTAVFYVDYQEIRRQYSFAPFLIPEPLPFDQNNLKFNDLPTSQQYYEGLFKKYHEFWQALAQYAKKANLRVKIYPQDYYSPDLFKKIKLINLTIDNCTYTVPAYLNEVKTYIPNLNELTACEFLLL